MDRRASATGPTVTVYCGSYGKASDCLVREAREAGRSLVRGGWRIVYGGGSRGLMGGLSEGARSEGGELIAVTPGHIVTNERVTFPAGVRVVRTESLRERKRLMDELAQAFLVLPGGVGTLEEFLEVLTLYRLGTHSRPIVVLDSQGCWQPLQQQFDLMVALGLTDEPPGDYVAFRDSIAGALASLESASLRCSL